MSSPSRELGSEMGFYLMETVVRKHGEEVDERKLRAPSIYIFLSRIRIVLIGEAGQFCSKSERTGRRRRERARHSQPCVVISARANIPETFTPTSTRLIVADSADVENK